MVVNSYNLTISCNCMTAIVNCSFDHSYIVINKWYYYYYFVESSHNCHTINSTDFSYSCMSYRSCIAITAIKRVSHHLSQNLSSSTHRLQILAVL